MRKITAVWIAGLLLAVVIGACANSSRSVARRPQVALVHAQDPVYTNMLVQLLVTTQTNWITLQTYTIGDPTVDTIVERLGVEYVDYQRGIVVKKTYGVFEYKGHAVQLMLSTEVIPPTQERNYSYTLFNVLQRNEEKSE